MGTEIAGNLAGQEIINQQLLKIEKKQESYRECLAVLEGYLDESKFIYDLPAAAGNPDHPDVGDEPRKDYYMCRTANIVGAARQIEIIIGLGVIEDQKKVQALQIKYRELRRIDARRGLRTKGEMAIIKKDIRDVVYLLKGNYII